MGGEGESYHRVSAIRNGLPAEPCATVSVDCPGRWIEDWPVMSINLRSTFSVFVPTAIAVAAAVTLAGAPAGTPLYAPALYNGMRWRSIGPFYGGRVEAVAGISSQPDTFYFG